LDRTKSCAGYQYQKERMSTLAIPQEGNMLMPCYNRDQTQRQRIRDVQLPNKNPKREHQRAGMIDLPKISIYLISYR